MKRTFLILFSFGLVACNNQQTDQIKTLQSKIDSLEIKLADTYKPGLGDFMGTLQYHHSKLWFAGKNENWKLADFEIHELMETVEDIETFHAGRKDIEMINMIKPALDSVNNAIAQQNNELFESSFSFLTNTCNQCHQATGYEFNRVKTPETSPFSNQDFRPIE